MVETSGFAGIVGDLSGRIFSGAVWLITGLILFVAIAGILWYYVIYKKKFDIDVIITAERAGGKTSERWDKAAILTERGTRLRYFRLWADKLDLPIPKFEVLRRIGRKDLLEMYQIGDDELYFLSAPQIGKKVLVKIDGSIVPFASQSQKLMDTDTSYWNVKRKKINKGIFEHDSIFMKLIPFIPHMMSGIVIIFVLWMFLKYLPETLSRLESLAGSMNAARQIPAADVIVGFLPFLKCKI